KDASRPANDHKEHPCARSLALAALIRPCWAATALAEPQMVCTSGPEDILAIPAWKDEPKTCNRVHLNDNLALPQTGPTAQPPRKGP
ncbi:MAG: hypothetical protein Q7U56_14490, partial [Humidesulfovibrio sp.]|nr:hypothetical protein [Humidesulfovibrio sp.]